MRFLKPAINIVFLAISAAGSAEAANIEFIFFENSNNDIEAGGLLNSESRFRKELLLAGLYLGKRIESDVTLRIGIYSDQSFGGSAWGAPSSASPSAWTQLDDKQVYIKTPAALAAIRGNLVLDGNCETHLNMGLDFTKLDPALNVGILGVYLHEFMHGLGVVASDYRAHADNSLTHMTLYDTLISQDEPDKPDAFFVGGENVKQLFGRKVRTKEIFLREPLSHIGGSSSRIIRYNGEVIEGAQSNIFGEYSNKDVNASVLGSAFSYIHAPSMTPIDLGVLKDLGYPVSPVNSVFFFHSPEDFPPSSFNVFTSDFYNVLTIPMLRLENEVFSAHLAWDGELGFRVLGLANNGQHGFLSLSNEAPEVFQSTPATLDLVSGHLHVPNLELYEAGSVGSYSASFRMKNDSLPMIFEMVELVPKQDQVPSPSVSFTVCEDTRQK